MMTSFSTALSALNATSTAVDVVGNDLANLNTSGFKAEDVEFSDLMSQALGAAGSGSQVGLGVGVPTTKAQFVQGSVQQPGGPLDCGID